MATAVARLDAMLREEMEDFLFLHFPPEYSFCAIKRILRIPSKPLSDAAFAAIYDDLSAIALEEKSGIHGSIKDKIYCVRRLLHHAMRVVDAEAPSHRVRLALDEHVGVAGGYSLTDSRGLHSVDHDVDLMLFDRDTDMTLVCIQVRDSEVGSSRR